MTQLGPDRMLWIARNILPHEPALRLQLARWRLPDDLDADDVVQESYGRFAMMQDTDAIRHPRNYLFSVARSIILMHVRHSRVVSIRAVDDIDTFGIATDDPSPEEQVSDREQLHLLACAIADLPDPGRQAFLWRVVEELPHREIGRRLGLSENAVQKSIARCLTLLAASLGRGGNGHARASYGRTESGDAERYGRTRE